MSISLPFSAGNALTLGRLNNPTGTQAGSSTARLGFGGMLFSGFGSPANVGTGETDLYSRSVLANTLAVDGQSLRGRCAGLWASNGNAGKTVRVKFAGTTFLQLGPSAVAGGQWWIEFVLTRISITQARVSGWFLTATATPGIVPSYITDLTISPVDFTIANTLVLTGQSGVTSGDVTAKDFKVFWEHTE